MEKYGVDNIFKSDKIKEQIKNTWIKNYGSDNPNKSDLIKEKIKRSNIEKYGVNYPIQLDEVKEKSKYTCLKRYGVEYAPKAEFVKEKIKQTCLNRYGVEYFVQTLHNKSNSELELLSFIHQYFPNANKNKKIISPKELDIVIDDIKLGIEFNGCYWHLNLMKESNYHLNKTIKCNERGYRLIHIWEDEWQLNKDAVLKKLLLVLTNNEDLNFKEDEIILDRSWYNNISILNYKIIEEIPPKLICRNLFYVENCGYLKYKRCD